LVAGRADRIEKSFGLQIRIDLRCRERGVGTEIAAARPLPVSGDHRPQQVMPALDRVDLAGRQGASLQVAELVEDEQRMMAATAEVAAPSSPSRSAIARITGIVRQPFGVVDILVAGQRA